MASLPFDQAYGGDPIEMRFRSWSSAYLPYYWHFREVLRQSPTRSASWLNTQGIPLSDDSQKTLIRLSLYSYHCYCSLVDTLEVRRELENYLHAAKEYDVLLLRRSFSNGFSALYRAVSAIANVLDVINGPHKKESRPMTKILETLRSSDNPKLQECEKSFQKLNELLTPRTHLDHFHLAWILAEPKGKHFLVDKDLVTKGILRLEQPGGPEFVDAVSFLSDHTAGIAHECNKIYEILSLKEGPLDQFLSRQGWRVRYDDYGSPWNGKRPRP